MQAGIEVGVFPHLLQFHVTDRIRITGILNVHRVPHRRDFAGRWVRLAIAGPCDVIYFFEDLTALGPAFDNLNAVRDCRRQDLSPPTR